MPDSHHGYGSVGGERGPVRTEIERRVRAGEIRPDGVQAALADRLDKLGRELNDTALVSKGSALGWLFGRRGKPESPRGLYIHGGVGRGKSMLMDLFFQLCPERRKRRLHFHEFMREAHARINAHRAAVKAGTASGDDPIPPVAAAIAAETRLLCFDEFTVTDIADAMILSRLFDALFAQGLVLVATSNVAPDDLYRDGLNRPLFLPFVTILKAHSEIFFLDAPTDYRSETVEGESLYVTPLGPEAERRMDAIWRAILGTAPDAPSEFTVAGRRIAVPQAGNGAARFAFRDLMQRPLGASDYLELARRFDTVMLDGVPVMAEAERNEAKRFILLVDTLYDAHRRIVVSAAAPATALYRGRSGTEAFEFDRTVSRLIEMRSGDYLTEAAKRRGSPIADETEPEAEPGRGASAVG
ncbi:cell division protein ZapE [Aureimonas sp. AU12]|uniref:cell division protein ZapE n=1 Tax=Aureimonas sp. AU12 TaxID=1638161 RepID=UPI0007057500|nr:cell division protein ZapE [Aureimonas sp. AU12]BAT29678.1 putative ATPase, AFG1 family [Aureimonas sp. AU12]